MEIPLFPLPTLVLFPHVVLPLHIFEERYKLMINRCIDSGEVFGLVLLRAGAERESEETIHRVGVTARVVQVEKLDDGRMNILCAGESRFRVLEFTGNDPYWTGFVEPFEDTPDVSGTLQGVYDEVVRRYRRAAALTTQLKQVNPVELTLPESPLSLSYMVSYVLDLEPARKQDLLEMTSTVDRLTALIDDLDDTIRQLEVLIAKKDVPLKARGNGDLGKPH
jgi:Lon protease-like protein